MFRRTFMGCVLGLGLALAELYAPARPWDVPVPQAPRTCVWVGKGVPNEWLDPENWVGGRAAGDGDTIIVQQGHMDVVDVEVGRFERIVIPGNASVRVGTRRTAPVCSDEAWQAARERIAKYASS